MRFVHNRFAWGLVSLLGVFSAADPLAGQLGPPVGVSQKAPPIQPPVVQSEPNNSQFQGSVAEGQATATPIDLSLRDAIQRGLKNNLGFISTTRSNVNVRAQRLRVLSELLPNLTGDYTQSYNRVNLAAEGFRISLPANSPFQIPQIVTFGAIDARANLVQHVFDLSRLRNLKSADASVRASQFDLENSRDLVVQAVSNAYLVIISDAARVDSDQAQVDTSQTLFQRATDQRAAGTVPAIDQLRAEVQLRTDQQALLAAQNQLAKDKLSLARVIGLPPGQQFHLTDTLPFAPLNSMTTEDALRQAFANRADFKAAQVQVQAAEAARQAAVAQYFPTIDLNASFGDSGVNLATSHNVWGVTGALQFNIFSGGRIKAEVEQADVAVRQQRDTLADLRGRIDQEVRSALLDLQSARDQVLVAQRNVDLAHQTLTQSRDRFTAGVTDNVEVVQAQQSVVTADTNLINATYQHNLAKIELARSLGLAEENLNRFIGGSK